MSWCRWSTDIDNKCVSDLYIYDSVDDCIQVEVVGRRRLNYADNPYPSKSFNDYDRNDPNWATEFRKNMDLHNSWLEENTIWQNLPPEYSGKSYSFGYESMNELVEFLVQARKDGINFPDYVFDIIKEFEEGRDES